MADLCGTCDGPLIDGRCQNCANIDAAHRLGRDNRNALPGWERVYRLYKARARIMPWLKRREARLRKRRVVAAEPVGCGLFDTIGDSHDS